MRIARFRLVFGWFLRVSQSGVQKLRIDLSQDTVRQGHEEGPSLVEMLSTVLPNSLSLNRLERRERFRSVNQERQPASARSLR